MSKRDQVALRFSRWAEEVRTIASKAENPENRDAMLSLADDYDRMAERAIAAELKSGQAK